MTVDGLTLAVTSSTGVLSLAIGRVADGATELLAQSEVVTERRHAEEISPRLAELLATAGVGFGDLDRLAVDVGPGHFTGLRVGVATVRALAFALDRPVVGLSSLAILAAAQWDGAEAGPVTAVIDARRGEVFQQTFTASGPGGPPSVVAPEEGARSAVGLVVGDGVDRYPELYRAAAGTTGARPELGVTLAARAMLELSQGRPGSAGTTIVPDYLREPDAVANIRTRVGAGS